MSLRGFEAIFMMRKQEVFSYLQLVESIEEELKSGPPRIGEKGPVITTDQQKILYANVYLQLYNLVEATITRAIEEICEAVVNVPAGRKVYELNGAWRREWTKFAARTNVEMAADKRLEAAWSLTEHLIDGKNLGDLKIDVGGGGNWDDKAIEVLADRLGCSLSLKDEVRTRVKRHVRDDMGPLALVKSLRNRLAHGAISFSECGSLTSASDLRRTVDAVLEYLEQVVESLVAFLDNEQFLLDSEKNA